MHEMSGSFMNLELSKKLETKNNDFSFFQYSIKLSTRKPKGLLHSWQLLGVLEIWKKQHVVIKEVANLEGNTRIYRSCVISQHQRAL